MDWYCAVWNSDKVNNEAGAEFLYERICAGDSSLVCHIEFIDEFCNELDNSNHSLKLNGHKLDLSVNKGDGFAIIGCHIEQSEEVMEYIQNLAKGYGLSFYEPQNMTYIF